MTLLQGLLDIIFKKKGIKIDNFLIHTFSTCITVHLIYMLDA